MFKRALISTSDKTGLMDLGRALMGTGCEIVSTGGTSKFLRDNGIMVREVGDVTGFPEVMDGRVRTLHPKIHMGLLARSHVAEDMELLKQHGVEPFDLVVVNLYPFEQAYNKGLRGDELIEQIDIGGPSLLRAASKSFERVAVFCDPADYSLIFETIRGKALDQNARQNLAAKVFEHCAFYDSLVARALRGGWREDSAHLTLGFRKKAGLRYGENPHQRAAWYESPFKHPLSLAQAQQLQGKELSYNNILDLEAAVGVVADFEQTACAVIKHLSPCGVAVDDTVEKAYQRAFDADPISAFGGIVALNRGITKAVAEKMVGSFLECVIAPSIDDAALKILSGKKNLRVLKLETLGRWISRPENPQDVEPEFKSLRGGALVQTPDFPAQWRQEWKIIGAVPDDTTQKDLIFAQRVVRHVKSNAIVVARHGQTLGLCGGQTNRVDSVKWALERAKRTIGAAQAAIQTMGQVKDLVLASDAFFPFRDSVDLAAQAGVKWIIQPGGSLRDAEVESAAKENQINMVITGTRHFKH